MTVFALQSFSPAEPPFRLVSRQSTITLYERWITTPQGEVRELKAVFEARSPIKRVLSVLQAEPSGDSWDYGADHHVLLSVPEQHGWLVYSGYEMPWPMQDQDCLLIFQPHWMSAQLLRIPFHSLQDNRFPQSATRDRISGVHGEWLIASDTAGIIKITYRVSSDRSKKIPRWVSDPVIHAHLLKSLQTFKQTLEQS